MKSLDSQIQKAKEDYQEALKAGKANESLEKEVDSLEDSINQNLKQELLPYRKKTLQKRKIVGKIILLLKHGTALKESNLPFEAKKYIQDLQLLDEDMILPEDFTLPSEYEETCYQAVFSQESGYLFFLDGKVRLVEKNNTWEIRKEPIQDEILIQKGKMISSSEAYLVTDEEDIVSLSYPRVETVEDLLRMNAYEI